MTQTELAAELKATFLFEACTDEQLRWVVDHSTVECKPAREMLFSESLSPDAFWVLLDGEIQFSRTVDGREIVFETASQPGSWAGWLPNFEINPVSLNARVVRDSRLLRLPIESLRYVIANGFPLVGHLLAGIMSGVRTLEGIAVQQQKLAALGRFSAGLAHELNNPAAAANRAASDLRAALKIRDERGLLLIKKLNADQFGLMLRFVQEVRERERIPLGPLERNDREDELGIWLETHGVENGYLIGAAFVDVSVTIADVESVKAQIPAGALSDAICWLAAAMSAEELAKVIETSVARISTLVGAIKEYTFMDRDGQQEVDLHEGIDNTLLILNHELKAGVEVIRDYDLALPTVCTYGSELNQVWTNLIDNAVQAMGGKGQLRISTSRSGDRVVVEIADNGPGIPEAIKDRIFEPFFTTKEVGVGTGLGLDIVRRIVWHHGGEIQFESEPGNTRFKVRLPIDR